MSAETTSGGLGRKTLTGMLWAILSFAGGRALTFVTVLVLARLLAPSEFGVVAATLVYLAFLELASDLGMKATVVYEQERGLGERLQTAFTVNLVIATLLTGLGVAFAPLVAGLFGIHGADHVFRLAALSVVFTALGNIHDSVLLRDLAFRSRAVPLLGRSIVRGAVSIALAFAGLGADALVWGMLVGAIAFSALQWRTTRFRPNLTVDRAVLRSMAGYGAAQGLLGVIALVATRVDSVVVARALGEQALGLYTMAFRVPELLLESVAWQVSLVAFPALSRQRAIDELGLGRATLKLVRFQALYSFPVAAGLAVLAQPLVVTLFSGRWAGAGSVLTPVALMLGFYTASLPMGEAFRAVGRQRWLVTLTIVQLPTLVLGVTLASRHGITAVAWTRAATVLLHSCLTYALVMRVLRIPLRGLIGALTPGTLAALGAAAGAGALRLAWPADALAPLALAGVAAAAGAVVALRALAPDTLRQLAGQIAELRLRRTVAAT